MKRVGLLVVLVIGATSLATLLLYQPIQTGSTSGPDRVGLIDVAEGTDEEPTTYTYRYAPGGDYYTLLTIRNAGPLQVAIVGLDPARVQEGDPSVHAVLWADELLLAGGADVANQWVEARNAISASGSVIPSGDEIVVWVHWRMGRGCPEGGPAYTPGTGAGLDEVGVAWTVLGLPRVSTVSLGYDVLISNPEDDPVLSCAE